MDEEQIRKLCPQVDRVTIMLDGTIGLKVGEFAQAINIGLMKGGESAERKIKDLYYELLAMNRQQQEQQEAARDSRA